MITTGLAVVSLLWTISTKAGDVIKRTSISQAGWCHSHMGTISTLLALCDGKPPMDSPHKWQVMQSFDIFVVSDMATISTLLALCDGKPPMDSPHKWQVMQSFDIFVVSDMGTISTLLALCVGKPPMDSPHKWQVMQSFDIFVVSDMGTISTLLALWDGKPPRDSPHKWQVMQSFDISFVVSLKKNCWTNSQVASYLTHHDVQVMSLSWTTTEFVSLILQINGQKGTWSTMHKIQPFKCNK